MARKAQNVVNEKPGIDPNMLTARALGELIYGTFDDQRGAYSALRGHDLARSMYGWNYQSSDSSGNLSTSGDFIPYFTDSTGATTVNNPNTAAFNGLGRMRVDMAGFNGLPTTDPLLAAHPGKDKYDGFNFVNYMPGPQNNANRFMIDPERYAVRDVTADFRQNTITGISAPLQPTQQRYFGGFNVPYTYPDNNNVYLAAVRASDGQVLIPSFHRPYLFKQWDANAHTLNPDVVDAGFLTNQGHPDWYRPSGRYKLLRSRPIDNLTAAQISTLQGAGLPYPPNEDIPTNQLDVNNSQSYPSVLRTMISSGQLIPFPTDAGGDVKNLLGSPGGNDSVWLDLGLPVATTSSGKKYKPMVAYLVVDMDGRINLNAAGNIKGLDITGNVTTHASAQGLGRHEISLARVVNFDSATNPTEWKQLLSNTSTGVPGRYDGPAASQKPVGPPDGLDPSGQTMRGLLAQPYSGLNLNGFPPNSPYYMPPYYKVNFTGESIYHPGRGTQRSSIRIWKVAHSPQMNR